MNKRKKSITRVFKLTLSAAVIMIVIALNSPSGKAAIGKIKDMFVPRKVVVNEVEGMKEPQQVDLKESSKGYIIYFDKNMYTLSNTGAKDRIEPKQKDTKLPDIYMEIEQIKDKKAQTVINELISELKSKYSSVRNIGEVSDPLKGTLLLAQSGTKWNDILVKYYIVDNTKGGAFVIKQQLFIEASEGYGKRFDNMLKEFKIVEENQKIETNVKKSDNNIREAAYQWLSEESKETIIDWKDGKVEEYRSANDHLVATHSGSENIREKDTYKVTFRTTDEPILGPITIYLEKNSYNILGVDFRD